jgi:Tfp pilus assembly protein PilV
LEENQKSTKREAKKKRKESEDAKKQWRLYLLAKGRATYSAYLEYINNPIQLETIVEAAVSYFFLSLYSRFLDCSPAPCRILSRARVSRQLPVENLERSGGHTHTHTPFCAHRLYLTLVVLSEMGSTQKIRRNERVDLFLLSLLLLHSFAHTVSMAPNL